MERPDPYRPPRAGLSQRPTPAASAAITRNMIDSLAKTRPWVLLIGIVMIVGCVFMVFAGLAMFALGEIAGVGGEGVVGGGKDRWARGRGARPDGRGRDWCGISGLRGSVLLPRPVPDALCGRHQEDRACEPGGDGGGARAPGLVLAPCRDPLRPAHRSVCGRDCRRCCNRGDGRGRGYLKGYRHPSRSRSASMCATWWRPCQA